MYELKHMHKLKQVPLLPPKKVVTASIPAHKHEELSALCRSENCHISYMVRCGIAMAMMITKEQRQAVVEEFDAK